MKLLFLVAAVTSLYFIVEANKEGKSPIDIGEQVVGIGIGMIAGTIISGF